MEIVTAFPTPILIKDGYDQIKLNEYEKHLKQNNLKTERNNYMNVDSSWTKHNLINDNFFNDLKKFIKSNIEFFIKQLGFFNFKTIEILNMWHNISKPGDSLFPHIHKGSLISGAFYVKGSGNHITFHNKELFNDLFPSTEKENKLHYDYCKFECKPGRLILFKSNTLHSTEKQKQEEKIVISFNAIWK